MRQFHQMRSHRFRARGVHPHSRAAPKILKSHDQRAQSRPPLFRTTLSSSDPQAHRDDDPAGCDGQPVGQGCRFFIETWKAGAPPDPDHGEGAARERRRAEKCTDIRKADPQRSGGRQFDVTTAEPAPLEDQSAEQQDCERRGQISRHVAPIRTRDTEAKQGDDRDAGADGIGYAAPAKVGNRRCPEKCGRTNRQYLNHFASSVSVWRESPCVLRSHQQGNQRLRNLRKR